MDNNRDNVKFNDLVDNIFPMENDDKVIEPTEIKVEELLLDKDMDKEEIDYKNSKKKVSFGDYVFDDGIDTEVYERDFWSFLRNKKFLMVISILIFIFVCILLIKTIYLRDRVDTYEEYFTVIEKKEEEFIRIDEGIEIDNEVLKKVAANELINCIKTPVDKDKLPDSVRNIINEINNYYNQSNNYFAFKYVDIFSGFSVSYNENQNIFTASTIKAPKDIYLYEMASKGDINLDEKLTYTSRYFNSGSGILKNKKFNTEYSVRELIRISTVESDNAAHNMLMDRFGRDNMYKFWKDKGTSAIFTANNNWGITNAHDAVIYMQELYRFYVNDKEYGEALMNNFLNARPKFITGKNNYLVANKSGWSGSAIHDVSIIFADNPYIVVALSNLGDTDYYASYFWKVNDMAYRLHTEYWKYKMDMCGNISQY